MPMTSSAPIGDHRVIVHTGFGHGSTYTKIRRFTTQQVNVGGAIVYNSGPAGADRWEITQAGFYAISYTEGNGTASAVCFGITLNEAPAEVTMNISAIAATSRLAMCDAPSYSRQTVSVVVRLAVGDTIRAHTDGNPDSTAVADSSFSIRKIGNA